MDGPLAAWEALCRLEQRLREIRAHRTAEPALAAGAPARRHLALVGGSGAH
jgi:ferric-dicitrate binding protein FerR (iron transport regulator)